MIFAGVQTVLYLLFYAVIFLLSVWALIDAARRPASAFTSAGKQTKQRWLLILGAATAVAFIAVPYPLGIGQLSFLALGSAAAAVIYLVSVRPAVEPYSRRRRGGGSGPSRGGW